MATSSPVRIGVLGSGGRLRGILRRLIEAAPPGRIQIVAAYDPFEGSLDEMRSYVGVTFDRERDEESLAQRNDVDWVFIGSWNCHHARQAILALLAGKHVFCE